MAEAPKLKMRSWLFAPGDSEKKMGKALAIRWTLSPKLVLRQCHRTAAVLLSAFLLFMATTGLLLVVPELLSTGAYDFYSAEIQCGFLFEVRIRFG